MVGLTRQLSKPVYYVVNKIDDANQEVAMADFFALGLEHIYPLSAEHRYGLSDLMDAVAGAFPSATPAPAHDMVRVAVVGRPNAGKSIAHQSAFGERPVGGERCPRNDA
jgi:GTP-binding protein